METMGYHVVEAKGYDHVEEDHAVEAMGHEHILTYYFPPVSLPLSHAHADAAWPTTYSCPIFHYMLMFHSTHYLYIP